MMLPTLKIIHELRHLGGQSISLKALMQVLDLDAADRRSLIRFLDALVIEGLLRHMQRGRYTVRKKLQLVSGVVQVQLGGHAFLVPSDDKSDRDDLYISSYCLLGAMSGDSVVALVLPEQRGHRSRRGQRGRCGRCDRGLIVEITQRAHATVLGCCHRQHRSGSLVLQSEHSGLEFIVAQAGFEPDVSGDALDGQVAVLAIDRYPGAQVSGQGHIIEVFGEAGDPQVDIRMALYRQGIPTAFTPQVQREAEQVAVAVCADDYSARVDLCEIPLVTIDGEDARDFDDAVAVKKTPSGWKMWVAIADVGHYVRSGSALDAAARERGTSVYFPGSCVPMLPEVLSNGICSLNPHVERLVLALELDFDQAGQRTAIKAFSAVMRSHARLTYEQVQQCIDGGVGIDIDTNIAEMLGQMCQLAKLLRSGRTTRGALDFDLPEADIRLNEEGLPYYIGRMVRTESHRLIEEFMLCANEAVAAWVLQRRQTALFRVHDAPDTQAMQSLQQFVATFDMGFNVADGGVQSQELLKLLRQAQGSAQEYTINRILLRSMKRACYAAENRGHFGLASEAYCHFTSPIRRYPDLMQHRIVLKLLAGDDRWPGESLVKLAEHTTAMERRAMLAERDVVDLRKCQFMADKVGLRYSGYITAVTAFGFFVELNEFFIEGLVHVRTLNDDFYRYDPEQHSLIGQGRRNIFQVGMAVTVDVWQVRPDRRKIDFVLPGMDAKSSRLRSTQKRGKKVTWGDRKHKGRKRY
ncbi:MAG: ribonuclease R [Thermodesulfobacteriota bacterium]|nr:ribonuclease R [Thermodesulfobacteriota bacterium]